MISASRPLTVLLVGGKNSGKTERAMAIVVRLRQLGCSVAGILARGLWEDGQRSGFDLYDVGTGRTAMLARRNVVTETVFGEFGFFADALRMGHAALKLQPGVTDVVVVDEVGRWELLRGGWAEDLDRVKAFPPKVTMLVVRDEFAQEVAQRWGHPGTLMFDIEKSTVEQVLDALGA